MTAHIVYPANPDRQAAPWSIGNNLLAAFSAAGHRVEHYEWDSGRLPVPESGDMLIGHPHDSGNGPFDACVANARWAKRIAIAPWNGSDLYTERLARVAGYCDAVFGICGPYWAQRAPDWITPIDMAIDPAAYPQVRYGSSGMGKRKVLYIGCTLECKGTRLISDLSRAYSELEFGHVGPGVIPGTYSWGYVPMESEASERIWREYDFLIAPGSNDANPTTVLEACARGLIPISMRTAGWGNPPSIIMRETNPYPDFFYTQYCMMPDELDEIRQRNLDLLGNYSWDKFCGRIIEATL